VSDAVEAGTVECVLPGGEGLVRTESGTCLVPNAVPGDVLDVRLETRRRGARRGEIQRVTSPSSERLAEPGCNAADACGGCALQFVQPAYQASLKNDWVRQAFAPVLDGQVAFTGIGVGDVMPGTRRRVRWRRGEDVAGSYWGFQARASHDVVRHDACLVAVSGIRQLHGLLADLSLPGVNAVQVTALADGIHLVFEGDDAGPFPTLPGEVDGLPVQAWHRGRDGCVPLRRPVYTLHDRLPAGQAWIDLVVGPDDFIQASRAGNAAMIRQVQAWSTGAGRVADLFSGFGNLSLPLAATGASVVGAEGQGSSVAAANRSARQLGLDARYMQADLFARFDPAPFAGMDMLILDPPRKGAKRACAALPRLLPRKLILISCDIAAGARDAAAIAGQGYRLVALRALDMFPYAGHVEAMSLWEL
jgi:23S rRNA (uracil1939-C5)-methyltransferase